MPPEVFEEMMAIIARMLGGSTNLTDSSLTGTETLVEEMKEDS